ncbi:hypothetical protein GCM10009830_12310 [Glycomyces endophyticus]|uniref:Uncharacterized protein n=1 Tax=Glycomyces endophyticus TaxID=480996 RepID=A0ABP4S6K1_9ACTN
MPGLVSILLLTLAGTVCAGGVAVGIVFLVKAAHDAEQRRRSRNAAWAAQHGLHYVHEDPSLKALTRRDPFTATRSLRFLDVYRGLHRGRHLVAYTAYERIQRSDDSTSEWYAQVVAVDLPALRPFLEVKAGSAGRSRFEVEVFNQRFNVQSDNLRYAHDVITPRMIEFLLTDPRARATRWRMEGRWLIAFWTGAPDKRAIAPVADFLLEVRARIPAHVWSDR